MSIAFSDTTNKDGIIQQIERAVGFNDGEITGNTTRFAQFTGDVNAALDDVTALLFSGATDWQYDDKNHTAYPIITTNIVSGQRDYTFDVDGQSNIILDVFKVMIADSAGTFRTIEPVDQQGKGTDQDSYSDTSSTGTPETYDKTGSGLFLDPLPNYSYTAGLKMFINREGSYFAVSDTTKLPGFPGLFHEYLVLHPAYKYARDHSLPNKNDLKKDMLEMRENISNYMGSRERDSTRRITPAYQNNH